MSKHTRGPWRIEPNLEPDLKTRAGGDLIIAKGENFIAEMDSDGTKADARLIAASPDMYKALQMIARIAKTRADDSDFARAIWDIARMAKQNADGGHHE